MSLGFASVQTSEGSAGEWHPQSPRALKIPFSEQFYVFFSGRQKQTFKGGLSEDLAEKK